MNQMECIRKHLVEHKTITSMEAFKLYGCTRLSAKIFDLRNSGWVIGTIDTEGTTRFGDTCHYATYKFISKPEVKK